MGEADPAAPVETPVEPVENNTPQEPEKPKTLTGYLQSEGIKPENIRK
jgi:hypothetical protein